ncbi:Peptidase S41 [Fusarium albosuccineum]|uniref:Peptidase S41 n=1 Tax=Fusarium albosuccineum TaxID=1237068 RepID=A0A8H4L2V8_9HYPO|nr:Peptidase S41 [Fusarium albosuccineum]
MFSSFLLLALPLGLPVLAASSSSQEPCALVTDISNTALRRNTSTINVPGKLAQDCLLSMPFYPERAQGFLDELDKYVQWQSTLEALKDPPDTYSSSSTDIVGGLEKIRKTDFSSHYEFDLAIYDLFNSANDGHLSISTCSLGIFTFSRENTSLVSVSSDGVEEPELYTFADLKYLDDDKVKVSPVEKINGKDAFSYLESVSDSRRSQDPDARYNQVFYALSNLASGSDTPSGAFINNDAVHPRIDVTTIEFRNGSSMELKTMAVLNSNDFIAKDGEALFDLYCLPAQPSPSDSSETTDKSNEADSTPITPPKKSGPVGYPKPQIRDPYNQITGYNLDDDTSVMFIPSFLAGDGVPNNQSRIFSETATQIVEKAVADGRTKLIIDVSGNGGGEITRAFNLFKLFFPSEFPYSATRFRRHEASEGMVKVFQFLNRTSAQDTGPLEYAGQVTPDQESGFDSYEDLLGDTTQLGVKVSSLYANFNYTSISTDDSPIRGFGTVDINKKQPFKAENILIVSDGVCASTCTTFVNLMTNVGGVQALTFGGRPNGKPMQVMGGVRGAQSQTFEGINQYVGTVEQVLNIAAKPDGSFDFMSPEEFQRLKAVVPRRLNLFPIVINGGNVNLRNAYQEGDDDLPLQFQYQASDCRLYYTAENIQKPETAWESAAEAIWGSGSCVKGSTGGVGSLEDKDKDKKKGSEGEGGEEGEEGKKKPNEGLSVSVCRGMFVVVLASVMVLL